MDASTFFASLDKYLEPLTEALYADKHDDPSFDTWDNDEVERWLDNDYGIYTDVHAQARWMTTDELADYLLTGIDWEILNADIDTDEVDWHGIAARLIAARPDTTVRYT